VVEWCGGRFVKNAICSKKAGLKVVVVEPIAFATCCLINVLGLWDYMILDRSDRSMFNKAAACNYNRHSRNHKFSWIRSAPEALARYFRSVLIWGELRIREKGKDSRHI